MTGHSYFHDARIYVIKETNGVHSLGKKERFLTLMKTLTRRLVFKIDVKTSTLPKGKVERGLSQDVSSFIAWSFISTSLLSER